MGYADRSSLLARLSLSDANPDDAADVALAYACDDAVAVQFERRAGYDVTRTPIWGASVTATATARTIDGGRDWSDLLFLPTPVRGVSAVAVVGLSPETLTADQWALWRADERGNAWALRRLDGAGWPVADGYTRVQVTAVWADGPVGGEPPAIVIEACTFLAADEYRLRKTSPTGEIGPEGFTIRPRNPWNFDVVQAAIEAVRAPAPLPGF